MSLTFDHRLIETLDLKLLADMIVHVYSSCTDAPECRSLNAHNESTRSVTESAAAPGALAHWEEMFSLSSRAAGSAQKDR